MKDYRLRFGGAKHIQNFEGIAGKKPSKKKGKNYKLFWAKLFSEYSVPLCPLCRKELALETCHVEQAVQLAYPSKNAYVLPQQSSKIELVFRCYDCNAKIEGIGKELRVNKEFFTLELLAITRIQVNVK